MYCYEVDECKRCPSSCLGAYSNPRMAGGLAIPGIGCPYRKKKSNPVDALFSSSTVTAARGAGMTGMNFRSTCEEIERIVACTATR